MTNLALYIQISYLIILIKKTCDSLIWCIHSISNIVISGINPNVTFKFWMEYKQNNWIKYKKKIVNLLF